MSVLTDPNSIVVAILGARMHYAVPHVLMREGLLARFYPDLYISEEGSVNELIRLLEVLPVRALKQISGRTSSELPDSRVRANNWLGFQYALSRRLKHDPDQLDQVFSTFGSRFARWVAGDDLSGIQAVYALNSELWNYFKRRSYKIPAAS
jgi:hypothetical protein